MRDLDHVLVLGLDPRHVRMFGRLRDAERHCFHPLYTRDEVRGVDVFSVNEWLAEARQRISALEVVPDGIVNYWDFPLTEMAAILASEYQLRAATLESLVRLQHKYLARLLQQDVAPDVVPAFEAVDVYDDGAVASIGLPLPYWLKPIRSFRSHLGFRIASPRDLARAISELRAGLPRLADPYDDILARTRVPDAARRVGGRWCIAEAIISGRQCTLEGWSQAGDVHVYGAVDSVRTANRSSFDRYPAPASRRS